MLTKRDFDNRKRIYRTIKKKGNIQEEVNLKTEDSGNEEERFVLNCDVCR
jgi:hypothetical protein